MSFPGCFAAYWPGALAPASHQGLPQLTAQVQIRGSHHIYCTRVSRVTRGHQGRTETIGIDTGTSTYPLVRDWPQKYKGYTNISNLHFNFLNLYKQYNKFCKYIVYNSKET